MLYQTKHYAVMGIHINSLYAIMDKNPLVLVRKKIIGRKIKYCFYLES